MKRTLTLHYILCYFIAIFLVSTASINISAQNSLSPIPGSIYGQAIVACGSGATYESVATDIAVYARPLNKNDYYANVWTAPQGMGITSFSEQRNNGHHYRAILLHDNDGNAFVVYNKINGLNPDSTITGPVLLPRPLIGYYNKIVAGGHLHVYSFLPGGPQGRIIISGDNGLTWAPDSLGIAYENIYDLAADTAGNVYSVGTGGIYKQLAASTAWAQLNTNPHSATAIFIDRTNRIVTGGYASSLYISTNGGASFNIDNSGIASQVLFFADDANGNLYAVAGGSAQVGGAVLYQNIGGTGSWVNITAGLSAIIGIDLRIKAVSGDSLICVGTANDGMFTSDDLGVTFTETNNGIHAEDIYSIITQPGGRQLCTADLGIYYKDPADTLWRRTYPVTGYIAGLYLYNDIAGNIFASYGPTASSPYPLAKSIDNGLHWSIDSAGFSAIGGSGFYIDQTGARHFYNVWASGTNPLTVWTAPLGSNTFNLDTAGLPVFPIYSTGVKAMCGDGLGYLYASLDMTGGDAIYRRSVTGTVWSIDTFGIGANLEISLMAANPSLGVIAVRGPELYHRTAGGWKVLSKIPGDTTLYAGGINALSVDAKGVIYASATNYNKADSNAVFLSKDTGVTWQFLGLRGLSTNGIVSTGDTTYFLTLGNWGYVLTGSTFNNLPPAIQAKATLKIFPNPSTSGIWTIQAGEEWPGSQLEVCDVNGKVVYKGVLNNSTTQINGQNLAQGLYVLRVYNASNSSTGWLVK